MKPGDALGATGAGYTPPLPNSILTGLFMITRGAEALQSQASGLKNFKGTAIHDGWSPDFNFEPARPVLGDAPVRRERAGLTEKGSLWAEQMHEFLLDLYNRPPPIVAAAEVRQHYHIILTPAALEEPPPQAGKRGKPKQSTGRNGLNRLKTYEEGVLALALEAGVPFTTNPAERDLRLAKVKQPVSGGFRTTSGADVSARLPGVVSTVRPPGLKVFDTRDDWLARCGQLRGR
ncbi:transposase [Thioploca ingrica]|uniref:Transposase n=1 Tax=Thioploca ingrica TaxID=40754 RepID=A0A090ACF2_9GAMM|nr:transposase [Thioploca ingrica]